MLKAAYAQEIITPPAGVDLAGYFNVRLNEGMYDDLFVKVVALEIDGKRTAFVSLELCSITKVMFDVIKAKVDAEFGEGLYENLLICATHTHTAPQTAGDPNSDVYNEFAGKKAAEALKDALANMEEGEIYTALAKDARFIFNRRYWMKDGRVVTNPGKLNPQIARPEGDIDPEIPIIAFRTAAGIKLLFTSMVNHTDTIGGCGVSARPRRNDGSHGRCQRQHQPLRRLHRYGSDLLR